MAKYMCFAPNSSSVTIQVGYSVHTFNHGTVIENDSLAHAFPNIFLKMDEGITTAEPTLLQESKVEPAALQESKVETPEVYKADEPQKRVKHGGRQKGTLNKKAIVKKG